MEKAARVLITADRDPARCSVLSSNKHSRALWLARASSAAARACSKLSASPGDLRSCWCLF